MAGYKHRDPERVVQENITTVARAVRKMQAELAALNELHTQIQAQLSEARKKVTEAQRGLHAAKTEAKHRIDRAHEDAAAVIAEAEGRANAIHEAALSWAASITAEAETRANLIRELAEQQCLILAEHAYDEGWRHSRDKAKAKRRTIREFTPRPQHQLGAAA